MIFLWLLLAVFSASCVLTLVLRRYALAKSLMDIPNERSSHSTPTPRGGGGNRCRLCAGASHSY